MLSRLQSQCEFFLNWGNQRLSILTNSDINEHINEMITYYNLCNPKPEWLKYSEIMEYKAMMMRSLGNIILI